MRELHSKSAAPVRAALGALSAMMLLAGCGGSFGSQPIAQFPSRDTLAALGATPAAKPAIPKTAGVVDQWQIESAPLADAGQASWEPVGAWETLFADVAAHAQKKPRLTLAMSCIARELGRFYLERQEEPDESLRRFLMGGCGTLLPDVSVRYFSGEAPAGVPDDELFAQSESGLRAGLERGVMGGADTAGFWFGRRDDKTVAFFVSGVEEARIKPFSLSPNENGNVVIEGRLNQDVAHFEALINYGSAAVEPCDVDIGVERPSFRFVCRPAPEDETAWIQMLYAAPDRVLATVFAQALVRRTPDVPPSYEAIRYGEPAPVTTAEQFTRVVVQQLNRVRSAVKLGPVTLASGESATATRLAPHYFAATLGSAPPEQADTIALGLLAGWDVGGMIRGGSLVSVLAPTMDAGRWLTSALEMPIGRHTLFDRDIEQVAFGPLVAGDPGAIGAVVTGYRFHHGSDHTDDVNMLLTRVVRARARMGLPPPLRLGKMDKVMKEELAAVHQGVASPGQAMDRVLQRAAQAFGTGMRGFVIEASSLEELQVPEEVLRQPKLHIEIGVTHHKAPGAAWAQYTILVIYAVLDTSTT